MAQELSKFDVILTTISGLLTSDKDQSDHSSPNKLELIKTAIEVLPVDERADFSNYVGLEGKSPFHMAVMAANTEEGIEVMKYFLDMGADPQIMDPSMGLFPMELLSLMNLNNSRDAAITMIEEHIGGGELSSQIVGAHLHNIDLL